MKKTNFLLFNLLISFLFQTSIVSNNDYCPNLKENHDYKEISHLSIHYENIFKQTENHYFVYFYSLTCGHCYELKNEIINYALCNKVKTYFVVECDEIKYGLDTSQTIGSSKLDSFFIKGYPTLIELTNHVLAFNEAGKEKILRKILKQDNSFTFLDKNHKMNRKRNNRIKFTHFYLESFLKSN